MFCNVKPDCVIENRTLPVLYEAPLMLEEHDFSLIVCRELGLWTRAPKLDEWRAMVKRIKTLDREVTIGLVGKYVQLHDAYLSVAEALRHACYACGAKVEIRWIDSETVTEESAGQYFAALSNMRTVGVMGDGRSYEYAVVLRSVQTGDFMTADLTRLPYELLDRVSVRIVNEVRGVNRILYDITSKPPATVELE